MKKMVQSNKEGNETENKRRFFWLLMGTLVGSALFTSFLIGAITINQWLVLGCVLASVVIGGGVFCFWTVGGCPSMDEIAIGAGLALILIISSLIGFSVKTNFDGKIRVYDFWHKEYLAPEEIYIINPLIQRAVYFQDIETVKDDFPFGHGVFRRAEETVFGLGYLDKIHFHNIEECGNLLRAKLTWNITPYVFGLRENEETNVDKIIAECLSRHSLKELFDASNKDLGKLISQDVKEYFKKNHVATTVNINVLWRSMYIYIDEGGGKK